jgi:glycosyltransferase involved in cell wall biosynthesis
MNAPPRPGLLSIAVPCFNEQHSIQPFVAAITPVLEALGRGYEILFVDDGSTDNTLPLLVALASTHAHIKVISLTRNFGKEAALTAALDFVSGAAVIPMDVDLQDPVELIAPMVAKWQAGADVVLAHRQSRPGDAVVKRWAARLFYRLISKLSAIPIPENVGDFRLMDRKVVDCVRQLPEKTRFMKGILAWPGFQSETIEFTRPPRQAGNSKWPLWKLFNYALDGIFSFSTAPLRVWTYIGSALSFFSLGYFLWVVVKTLVLGIDVPGYASTLSVILFFNGIILIGLGILGEYLGRVFIEVKGRPIYLVRSIVGLKKPNQD